jgi:hypothetical protein
MAPLAALRNLASSIVCCNCCVNRGDTPGPLYGGGGEGKERKSASMVTELSFNLVSATAMPATATIPPTAATIMELSSKTAAATEAVDDEEEEAAIALVVVDKTEGLLLQGVEKGD